MPIADQPRALPAAPAGPRTSNLPLPLTPLIGRASELATVRQLLAGTRLLTLTGAGGSGKTRIAIAAAAEWAADRELVWVELAALTEEDFLAAHVAAAVGIRDEGGRSMEHALVGTIGDRAILLVLDNCEHLVNACAQLAETLLRRCAHLKILATSREPLDVGGERSWLVPVLSLPAAEHPSAAAIAAQSEAVQLFVRCAQDALPAFQLADENAHAVARICRRVDGLPLAIELAAARVRVLAPEQIAARLDESFRVLAGGARTAPPRHRTLRAAIDWSYRLLDARERRLLERLSVFTGEWSIDAAEAICADEEVEPWEVLDLLAALVEKSLVTMREAHGVARYRLLETIREFAAEGLARHGGGDALRGRHARFFARIVAESEPDFVTPRRAAAVARVERELDNVRAALAWSLEQEPALHLRLCGMLPWLWYSLGLWAEGRRWLQGALALPVASAPTRERAAALFGAGAFASMQADTPAAQAWLDESIALARQLGDLRLAAYASNYLAMAYVGHGMAEGEAPALEALAWCREAGDLYGHRFALLALAMLYLAQKELARAADAGEQAVQVARTFGMDRELGIALQILGTIVLHRGSLERAESLTREALGCMQRDPQPLFTARALEVLALIAGRRGDPLVAARRFGAADAIRESIGAALFRMDRERIAPHVEAARAAAGEEAFSVAWEAGRRQRLATAVSEALSDGAPTRAPSAVVDAPAPEPPRAPAEPREPVVAPVAVAREASLRVLALGPLEIWREGTLLGGEHWRAARPRELLLYLLAHPEGRTREQMGLALWPDASTAQLKNNFHVTLHHLRKTLGDERWIHFDSDRYRVNPDAGIEVDAWTFEAETTAALQALRPRSRAPGVPASAETATRLRTALALYRGDFLADQGVGDWHLERRDTLRRLYVDALRALGEHLAATGDHAGSADAYRRLVLAEPLDEDGYRRLMRALANAGARGEALRTYERLVVLLRTDLETEPERETVTLHERIRHSGPV